jgi:POT family proton-dependent oligopeptide transporter
MVIGFVVMKWDGMLVWFSWNCNAFRSYSICLGTKFLGHVGSLDVQEANTVDESSYGLLFKNLLKSQMQLSLTIILSVLSIIGWYSLGWAFVVIFFFLTVIAALMMMIYKS